MKSLTFILLIISTTLFAQNTNDKIKGHWGGCNKEYGYNEMIISDSLIYYRDISGLGSFPRPYKYERNQVITQYSGSENDTIHLLTINKNLITRRFNNKEIDTLYLISKKTPYENINIYCEMEMEPQQYADYLRTKFHERAIKNTHKCISYFELDVHYNADNEKIDLKKLFDDLNNDPDFKLPDDFRTVRTDNIDFEIIEKTNKYSEPILVEFKTNDKNGLSLIIIDYYGRCYDDINIDFEIKDDTNVDFNISQTNMSCDKSCKLRLYFVVDTINYTIKNIALHDKNIK